MCKKYEECCSEEFDCGEDEIVEVTKEDVVQAIADEIANGGCLNCNLEFIYDYAYSRAKKDLAMESIEFYQDVFEEEE